MKTRVRFSTPPCGGFAPAADAEAFGTTCLLPPQASVSSPNNEGATPNRRERA